MVRVLVHQLEGSREIHAIEEPHRKTSSHDKFSHAVGAKTFRLKHVKGFGEHGDRGTQPFPQRPKGVYSSLVLPVLGIKESYQRTGVHQDHRVRFFLRRFRTVARLSVDGPIAYPPGPKCSSR